MGADEKHAFSAKNQGVFFAKTQYVVIVVPSSLYVGLSGSRQHESCRSSADGGGLQGRLNRLE